MGSKGEPRMINKWIISKEYMYNLNQVNRINYELYSGKWVLWLDFDDELIELCSGDEKKIKRRFKTVKEFLLSSDEIMEFKD